MIDRSAFLCFCHATFIVSAVLLPPQNIQLFSENFQHVLTWDDPNNESSVYYSVEYNGRSNGYVAAGSCTNITRRRCDLTKDFTDFLGKYNVLVKILSNHTVSWNYLPKGFSPFLHTAVGPPIVEVVPCDRCIRVSIQPPVSYLWREEEQQNVTMLSDHVYPIMTYKIQLVLSDGNETIEGDLPEKNDRVIPNLVPQTKYCVSVTVDASGNLGTKIPSALKCVITESIDSGSQTLLIVVCTVAAVLLFAGILLLLLTLDRTGFIFMRTSFVPKVLKSFSASESVFSGSPEPTQSTCVVPVEIIDIKRNDVEENQESEKYCGEGYFSRKRLLSSTHSDTGDTVHSGQLPTATSSSEDSSGHNSGSSAEGQEAKEFSTVPDCSSNTQPPVNASNKTSNLLFNNSGDFNINLNSVSIADPEEVWTGFRIEGSPREVPEVVISAQRTELALDADNSGPLVWEITMDDGRTSPFQYDGSEEEEEEDMSDNHESEEHTVCGYMKR